MLRAWRSLSPSVQRLWLGAGALFAAANAAKFLVWQNASAELIERANVEHESASARRAAIELCAAPRCAGVLLEASSKVWRRSGPARPFRGVGGLRG